VNVSWTVVGVDCATQEERMGLSHGVVHEDGTLELLRVTLGTAGASAADTIASWISGAQRYVVALDAPLGWPQGLSTSLYEHRAGQPIETEPDAMFRRYTDRVVHAELGKLPLEVGADRIARTARAALHLLEDVRRLATVPVPLAWTPGSSSGAIEVYPAATLRSRSISSSGYKGDAASARKARAAILERLSGSLKTELTPELLVEDDDLLDAALCAVAAADFARGEAVPPEDRPLAEREGWIWFRGLGQRTLF
jgi:predicted RNase H-like nuclease